jgi:hypothetical protein
VELSDSPESTVFYHSDHAGACFPAMEDIRRLGKLCDVTLIVGKGYPTSTQLFWWPGCSVAVLCFIFRSTEGWGGFRKSVPYVARSIATAALDKNHKRAKEWLNREMLYFTGYPERWIRCKM